MTSFEPVYNRTMNFEGHDVATVAGDPGGRTYCGISEHWNPTWSGWAIIDSNGPTDQRLPPMVAQFYQVNYWLKNSLQLLNSQEMAAQIFDAAVNLGSADTIEGLEDLLGVEIDGIMGPHDVAACNAGPVDLPIQFISFRKGFYRGLAKNVPNTARDLPGLEKRCVLSGLDQ